MFGWQYIKRWMELGLHGIRTTISEKDFILFYITFTLSLWLFFIYLCIFYFILFKSRHIPLSLCRKCILNHANIWDGTSLRNSQRSLSRWLFLWRASSWMFALVLNGFSGYFVLMEIINLSKQWWKDKLESNKLLAFNYSLYYFIDN